MSRPLFGSQATPFTTTPTQVSDVQLPADLIAMGDVCVDSRFEYEPYGYLNFFWYAGDTYSGTSWMERALAEFNRRHKGMFNIQFADGHIESGKPTRFFKLEAEPMRRWNNDHEPHLDNPW